ncbi:MAG: hypothetical protein Q8Q21_00475 [bacterium]|nr:hypothetical protein [bacterium]
MTSFSLSKTGDGQGVITGRGIFCGYNCVNSNANYLKGTSISLSVSPQSGSKFNGWSGACSGTGSCNVSMNVGKSVTARFTAMKNTLTVKITNSSGGSGTVSISEGQGKCSSSSCSHDYLSGKKISLVASANSGSEFKGWSGACGGSGSCSVTMDQAREVRANFAKAELATYSLNISVSGSGYVKSMNVLLGKAIHSASGIDCGTSNSACSANYQDGMLVTIVAVPDEGYKFSQWGGDTCKGSNQECRVAITKSKSIQAYFEKK